MTSSNILRENHRDQKDHLLEDAEFSCLFTDPKGIIQQANPAAMKLLNADRYFLKDRPLIAFIPEEDHQAFNNNLDRLIQGQQVKSWQTFINPQRGGPVPVALFADQIDDCQDQRIGLCWFLQDTRKSRQMDLAFRRQKEINEAIAKLSMVLLADARIEYISNIFLDFAKRITDSPIGYIGYIDLETGSMICPTMTKDLWVLCHIKDKNIFFETLGGEHSHESQSQRPKMLNDARLHSESLKMPLGHIPVHRFISAPSEINGMMVGKITIANSNRDYDEIDLFAIECLAAIYGLAVDKRRINDELEAERAKLEDILESTPFSVIISDKQERIQFANSLARRDCLPFLQSDEGANHIIFCDMKGIPYDVHDLPLNRSTRYGENISNETLIILTPDGNRKYLLANSAPIMGRWNKINGAVSTFLDITELKNIELVGIRQIEELKKQLAASKRFEEAKINSINHMEQTIRELKAEILRTKEDLLNAREIAENQTFFVSKFMDRTNSEIYELLNSIISAASVLLDEVPISERKYFAEKIKSCAETLLIHNNNFQIFLKIYEKKIELMDENFDLYKFIEDSIGLLMDPANNKKLELDYKIEENVPVMIRGDPYALRQVLVNLLSNSIKYTEKGEVLLTVSCKKIENNHEIYFAVKDTGIGISQDRISKLLSPYLQNDSSSLSKYAGTGLGLSVSKRLVELMGGRIWAQSEAGVGSLFGFTILAQTAARESEPPKMLHFMSLPSSGHFVPLKILLAEDNEVNQVVILRMLKGLGHTAEIAANGIEVASALESRDYDLLLIDAMLPGIDISEAAKIGKIRWPNKKLFIIAFNANAIEDPMEFFKGSADGFINKPILKEDLAEMLSRFFPFQIAGNDFKLDFIDSKENKIIGLLQKLGTPRNASILITILAKAGCLTSREIQKCTGLRQPDVSLGIKILREKNWLHEFAFKREKMGRSEKIYALNTSVSDIVEFIEREKLQELNKATEDIRRLKVLLAIN